MRLDLSNLWAFIAVLVLGSCQPRLTDLWVGTFCEIAISNGNLEGLNRWDWEFLREVIDGRHGDVDAPDTSGRTLLMCASRAGHMETVEGLLAAGADVAAVDNEGETALGYAIDGNIIEVGVATLLPFPIKEGDWVGVVGALLSAGAEVDVVAPGRWYGRTPLGRVAPNGSPEVAMALIEAGADVDAADDEGKTPLWLAVSSANATAEEVAAILVAAEADVNAANDDGMAVLMRAVERGHVPSIELLIANGADTAARDAQGRSVADYAPDDAIRAMVED